LMAALFPLGLASKSARERTLLMAQVHVLPILHPIFACVFYVMPHLGIFRRPKCYF
jgi:hypothetical protein